MEKIFARFAGNEDGNVVLDWAILLGGSLMLAASVGLSLIAA